MEIKKAQMENLKEIQNIYQQAREFMAAHGNPHQWGQGYPEEERIRSDILAGNCYICLDENKPIAVFYYKFGEDPTYHRIYEGNWLNNKPYGVVHRIASVSGKKGAASFCLEWCYHQYNNLKIDTHKDNIPMQNLLQKNEFRKCGKIFLQNGEERIAFQKEETSHSNNMTKM